MSRIGKAPIALPKGVEISVSKGNLVSVKGPKGTLNQQVDQDLSVEIEEGLPVAKRPLDHGSPRWPWRCARVL